MEWYTPREYAALVDRYETRCERELTNALLVRCALTGEPLAKFISGKRSHSDAGNTVNASPISQEAFLAKIRTLNTMFGGEEIHGSDNKDNGAEGTK